MSPARDAVQTALQRASARAWGIATGLVLGLGLCGATLWLVLKDGDDRGQHLGRLGQIFPGYDVSVRGAFFGLLYAFVVGYALGRLLAPRTPLSLAEREAELEKHVRINSRAWSLALGGLFAAAIFGVTVALVARGGEHPGELLEHLSIYFPGYAVSLSGALIGALWAFASGWLLGQLVAAIYNVAVGRAEQSVARS